ncbi:hypothetical protein [Dyadobacter sp. CY323]|uniref:hypothetical protein n=1 Tax=Dyadobacter sp. CY323 TaxID=2907302 RepID=UPI001F1BF4F6|nr:hypothetical protein [Dyadobacter sp. CY323]MCE6988752.1 hypothetical protein [Dyadobacter sp. CY323]
MRKLKATLILVCLAATSAAFAQTAPATASQQVPQTSTQQTPVPATTDDKKVDFNSPQSPTRSPQTPSEDTLIKGQRSSGAVIHDSVTPSADRKKDGMNRRKDRKGTAETGDTTSSNTQP